MEGERDLRGNHSLRDPLMPASIEGLLKSAQFTINIIMEYVERNENAVSPIDRTKRYIENHISEEISMDDIARNVHLTPDYLTRIFKREVGTSINRYIVNRRIDIAKKLLLDMDNSIGEIAFEVGYCNYSSFYKIFRKMAGMSPQEYKNMHRSMSYSKSG